MPFQLINVGTAPNSNDGDPLRVALQKVNDNFLALANVGPINGAAEVLTAASGNTDANIAMTWSASNSTTIIGSTSRTNGNIRISPRGTGQVILPSNTYVSIQGGLNGQFLTTRGNGQLYWSYGNGNSVQASGGNYQVQYNINTTLSANANFTFNPNTANLTVVGNIVAAGIYYSNGSPVSTGAGNYSNANVAAYLPVYTGNIAATDIVTNRGNIVTFTAGIASAGTVRTDNLQYANGQAYQFNYSNLMVANYLPTYTGALTSLAGNITTTGNIDGYYLFGNGVYLTGLGATYGNANVADYMDGYTGNITAGNVTAVTSVTANNLSANNDLTVSGTGYIYNISSGGTSTLTTANVQYAIVTQDLTATGANFSGIVSVNRIQTDNYYWANGVPAAFQANSGSAVNPAGSNTQIQFNNAAAFGASAQLTFNQASNTLSVPVVAATTVSASNGINGTLIGTHYGAVYANTIIANANITGVGASFSGTVTANNFISTGTTGGSANLNITGSGNLNLLSSGQITANAPVRLASYANTSMPTGTAGAVVYVSTTNQPAYYNGSSWRYFDGSAV
jgi:hypothetical protein